MKFVKLYFIFNPVESFYLIIIQIY